MPSIDQLQTDKMAEEAKNTPVDPQDVRIATSMGIKLMREGNGLQIIKDAIDTSSDPAQVVGQFLAQIIGQLAEQLGKEVDINPHTFLAKGGFLDNILNFIEDELSLPEEFSDDIYNDVMEVIKAAAARPEPPNDAMSRGGLDAQPQMPGQPSQGNPFGQGGM